MDKGESKRIKSGWVHPILFLRDVGAVKKKRNSFSMIVVAQVKILNVWLRSSSFLTTLTSMLTFSFSFGCACHLECFTEQIEMEE